MEKLSNSTRFEMRFSIVIPSYNQGRFIERTLRSVLGQNVDLEIIVVDGGSTDETVSILQKYDEKISWKSGEDGGQADAINRGLRESKGDVLAYLNSDDVYYPGALERVESHFQENTDSLILYGHGDHIDEEGGFIERYGSEPWDYDRLGEICYLCQPTVFWRREVIERYGLFDDRLNYAMDYEYWLRVGRGIDFAFIEGASLAGSRMYQENKTMSRRFEAHREILKIALQYGRSPFRWLKALAHISIEEERDENVTPETREFTIRFIERTLQFADEFGIALPLSECRELENHLKGAAL